MASVQMAIINNNDVNYELCGTPIFKQVVIVLPEPYTPPDRSHAARSVRPSVTGIPVVTARPPGFLITPYSPLEKRAHSHPLMVCQNCVFSCTQPSRPVSFSRPLVSYAWITLVKITTYRTDVSLYNLVMVTHPWLTLRMCMFAVYIR